MVSIHDTELYDTRGTTAILAGPSGGTYTLPALGVPTVPPTITLDHHALEQTTRRIGEEIFAKAESAAPSILSLEYFQNAAMQWLTRSEDLKLRLFRFIEVLPSLHSTDAIARHLQEYLGTPETIHPDLPLPMQAALGYRSCDSLHAMLASWAVKFGCTTSARQFICGSTPEEAIASVLRMRRRGMTFTLDVLGETVIADRVARDLQALYIRLIQRLGEVAPSWPDAPMLDRAPWGPIPRVNISIKLTGIVAKFDPIDPAGTTIAVLDRLRPILRTARQHGAFVNIDMEHYAVKDLTFDIFKRILTEPEFIDWPDCGIVVQTYLREADRDMQNLIAWVRRRGAPITIRLVKGAYWDAETAGALRNGWPIPVYCHKWESDAAFERVGRMMLENADMIRPAFASHNVRSIAAILAMEEALGLPPNTVEFQMLTGMGDQLKRALVAMNQRLRIYAPFGNLVTGMAYLIRRLIENTANESFLRQSFGGDAPIGRLLSNPTTSQTSKPPPLPKPLIKDPDEYAEMNPFQNEPDVDFSRPDMRAAMQSALDHTRVELGGSYPAIIDGVECRPAEWRDSLNPSDPSQIVGRVAACDTLLADKAVAAAGKAFEAWSTRPPVDRAAIMTHAAELLHDRRFEAASWVVFEVGKTWREAIGDIIEAIDYLRYYAYEMTRFATHTRLRNFAGEANEYSYLPRGVAAVISPVSFPIALLTGMSAAALVAGNTVVVKPATQAAACAIWLVRLLHKAGVPAGAINLLPGEGSTIGDYLVRHPDIDLIAFTGSSDVGARIVEAAGAHRARHGYFKHVVADMGGKNAIIVDDDADIDEAVQATIASAFGYAGQKCTSCSRVIVTTGAYDEFLAKLVEAASGIQPAAADLPGTSVGPMTERSALERARRWVEIGRKEARCVLEGRPAMRSADDRPDGGYYFWPVIFSDVPPNSRIAQEEMLAPILAVIKAATFAQAIQIANGTPYGLTAGVFSRSPANIEHARRALHVGTLYLNRKTTVSRVDRQPFGGFGRSGLGAKTGGPDYLLQFMLPRTVCENTMRHGFAPQQQTPGHATGTPKHQPHVIGS